MYNERVCHWIKKIIGMERWKLMNIFVKFASYNSKNVLLQLFFCIFLPWKFVLFSLFSLFSLSLSLAYSRSRSLSFSLGCSLSPGTIIGITYFLSCQAVFQGYGMDSAYSHCSLMPVCPGSDVISMYINLNLFRFDRWQVSMMSKQVWCWWLALHWLNRIIIIS